MNNFIPPDPNDPRNKLSSLLQRRKELQLINQLEENDALVETKEKIKEMEGQEMREILQVVLKFKCIYSNKLFNIKHLVSSISIITVCNYLGKDKCLAKCQPRSGLQCISCFSKTKSRRKQRNH